MSYSNYWFLICILVSQETDKVVWYSHLFESFPQFAVIHIVKGFHYDPTNVGSLISGFSAFLKSSLYIWKFSVRVLLKPNLKDFEHNLTFQHAAP